MHDHKNLEVWQQAIDIEKRITIVPGVCGSRPTIRGMRVTVADALELLAGGMTIDEILGDYSYHEKEKAAQR